MPRLAVALLLCLSACSDTAYPTQPPGPPPYDGPVFTASGVVIDSMTGEALKGVRVASGDQITYADPSGAWWLDVPAGVVSISTSPGGYERTSLTLTVKGPVYVALLVRRNAPFVHDCARDGDQVLATVTDLQGRKSIERWSKSSATFDTPTGPVQRMANGWQYLPPPDYYNWPIALTAVPANATGLRWDVYDTDGNRFVGTCEIATTGEQ